MHDIVVNELEDHLAGKASPAFHDHLVNCQKCRAEVESIANVSKLLAELRPQPEGATTGTAGQPSPFFYTRVAASIVEHQNTNHWGLLAPGAAFFRRVAFASLLVLACLGSYLVMREGDISGTDATTIMAQHDVTADHAASSDRDLILMTLATYGE
jgi:hypothetical protein